MGPNGLTLLTLSIKVFEFEFKFEFSALYSGSLASSVCFRPVRMSLSLSANMALAGKRFPVLAKYKVQLVHVRVRVTPPTHTHTLQITTATNSSGDLLALPSIENIPQRS